MHPDFATWLSGRPRGIGKAPVFPELAGKRISGGRGLSVQFRNIVEAAAINGRIVMREGKGRSTHSKTFHGLRHSFISQLANAGVAPEIRQKLAGHSDAEDAWDLHAPSNSRHCAAPLQSCQASRRNEQGEKECVEACKGRGRGSYVSCQPCREDCSCSVPQ